MRLGRCLMLKGIVSAIVLRTSLLCRAPWLQELNVLCQHFCNIDHFSILTFIRSRLDSSIHTDHAAFSHIICKVFCSFSPYDTIDEIRFLLSLLVSEWSIGCHGEISDRYSACSIT